MCIISKTKNYYIAGDGRWKFILNKQSYCYIFSDPSWLSPIIVSSHCNMKEWYKGSVSLRYSYLNHSQCIFFELTVIQLSLKLLSLSCYSILTCSVLISILAIKSLVFWSQCCYKIFRFNDIENILNLFDISMMLNKILIQWFWVEVTTKALDSGLLYLKALLHNYLTLFVVCLTV